MNVFFISCGISKDFNIGKDTTCKVQLTYENGHAVYGLVCDSETDLFQNFIDNPNLVEGIRIERSTSNDDIAAFKNSYFHGVSIENVGNGLDTGTDLNPNANTAVFRDGTQAVVVKVPIPTYEKDFLIGNKVDD